MPRGGWRALHVVMFSGGIASWSAAKRVAAAAWMHEPGDAERNFALEPAID